MSNEQAELDMGQEEPEETTRDALEAAFDEQEVEPETPETEVVKEPVVAEPEAQAPTEEGVQAEAPEVASTDKAPQSWTPAAREEWVNVPDSVKEVVAKREQEMQNVMQESAQARQFGSNFQEAVGQFESIFQGQGVDNLTGINSLLQTAAPLYGGTPQQKAETVAQIIEQFGVDISTLDSLLVGEAQAPMDPNMQAMQTQMNNMSNFIQQQQFSQQQNQDQQRQETNNEVDAFVAANEFAEDLRGVMADFMGMAGQHGQQLSLDDAYQRAIATRPDIQQIIANRAQGQHNEQALGNARNAAQSIPQSSGITNTLPPPQSTREALEQAWDEG